jgi:hypothetical protein
MPRLWLLVLPLALAGSGMDGPVSRASSIRRTAAPHVSTRRAPSFPPACAGNTSLDTALPLELGRPMAGIACLSQGPMQSHYWKASGAFLASDWFRLRVTFDNGATASDVDFYPVFRGASGQPVPFDALGSCNRNPGINEDCSGLLTTRARTVYVEAHALDNRREPFRILLEKTSVPPPDRVRKTKI